MKVPEGADRDFTASCFVVNEDGEVLMMNHSRLDMWLQPGGHVEGSETPDEAARREVREETGWEVEIASSNGTQSYGDDSMDLPAPFNVNLHRIEDGHWHCDLQFLARPVEKSEASHADEHDGQAWLSREEIEEVESPENAKNAAKKAIEEFSE